jgi:hypothetical protein
MADRTIQQLLNKAENGLLERLRQVRNKLNGEQIAVIVVVVTKQHTFWRAAEELETADEDLLAARRNTATLSQDP